MASTNTSLSFSRVATVPTSGMTVGAVYFETSSKRIKVATSATATETYGGVVQDATFSNGVLTITRWDQAQKKDVTFALDFSDVASTESVKSLLSTLRDDINTNTANIATLQSDVNDLKVATGTGTEGLSGKIDTLEKTVYGTDKTSNTNGLVKDVATIKSDLNTATTGIKDRLTATEGVANQAATDVASLQTNKADKNGSASNTFSVATPTADSHAATKKYVDDAVTSTYKVKGSVDNVTDLPSTNNRVGDVYNVKNASGTKGSADYVPAGTNYVWVGANGGVAAHWDALGGTFDLTGYATSSDLSGVSDRVGEIEKGYVKSLTSSHTNSSTTDVTDAQKNLISVTANTKATGDVTVNINETKLNEKINAMDTAIANAAAAGAGGVQSVGGQDGAITLRSGSTTTWDVNLNMGSGTNAKQIQATVVPPKSKGSSTQPVYFDSNGAVQSVSVDTTATASSNNLVTSGAAKAAATAAETNAVNTIKETTSLNALTSMGWVVF